MQTETPELATKPIRLRPSTHTRLWDSRLVEGETLDSVINRALDALDDASDRVPTRRK